MPSLLAELRIVCRRFLHRPLFALVAVSSLALGVGGTTAIFSIVQTVLQRPMSGIAEADRLVDIGRTNDGNGFDSAGYPDLEDLRREARSLDRVFAFYLEPFHLRAADGTAQRVLGFGVSREYFDALGVRPAVGRFFLPEEESAHGGAPVAVVSYDYFLDTLAGDASRIGGTIYVDSLPFTLVGVAPREFRGHVFALRPAVYVPLSTPLSADRWQRDRLSARESAWLLLGGRLAPGVALAKAQAELGAIALRVAQQFPDSHTGRGLRALPAGPVPGVGRRAVALFSSLLFVLVGAVLAIACLNVASMLLARAEERRRETAVRRALGAARGRIVREFLLESCLLFTLAVPLGLLLARWGVDFVAAFQPPAPFPLFADFPVDWRAAGFALALALVTGVVFGLAPALHAARRDPQAELRDFSATVGRKPLRARRALVGAQLAVSMLLLVVGGLLLRAMERARDVDPGFDPAGVVAFEFDLSLAGHRDDGGRARLAELVERARALPGIDAASATAVLPLDLSRMGLGGVEIEGRESPSRFGFEADANVVAPGFFATLRIPLAGRDFDLTDTAGGERVAIVNERFEREFLPGGALGRVFYLVGSEGREAHRIVGVARDFRTHSLGAEPVPFFWLPASQQPVRAMSLIVRSSQPAATVAAAVRTLFRGVDPDLPPGLPRPLPEVAVVSTLPQRLAASVASAVGVLGILLAALGLYGVLAYAVSCRQREIAVRVALGAERGSVLRLVFADAARPLALGLAVGGAASLAAAFALHSLLFGLPALDAPSFGGAAIILLAAAALACWAPARRALALDPAATLRAE
jgi:predicted permease